MDGTDEYQLPANILGQHPEEFYSAIGRVVCVCAFLEDQVTTLHHTLENARQGERTQEPVGRQINVARTLTGALPEDAARTIDSFLDATQAAFSRRNVLVHSSFPAQPDG